MNPLGVKGMGALGMVGIPAAIANAVFHPDMRMLESAVTRRLYRRRSAAFGQSDSYLANCAATFGSPYGVSDFLYRWLAVRADFRN